MVDFICMGLLTCEERKPRIKKRKILAHSWIRSRFVALLDEISIKHLNFDYVLPECAI